MDRPSSVSLASRPYEQQQKDGPVTAPLSADLSLADVMIVTSSQQQTNKKDQHNKTKLSGRGLLYCRHATALHSSSKFMSGAAAEAALVALSAGAGASPAALSTASVTDASVATGAGAGAVSAAGPDGAGVSEAEAATDPAGAAVSAAGSGAASSVAPAGSSSIFGVPPPLPKS